MKKRLFIPKARVMKMNQYLKEMHYQAGIGHVGGVTLRKKVIEKVAKTTGDKSPPSATTLAMWVMKQKTGQLK